MKRLFLIGFLFFTLVKVIAQPVFADSYPDSINKKRLLITAGFGSSVYLSGLSYLKFIWYTDHERVPFHYYNDSRGYLQIDKGGHAQCAYHESYAAYYALRWSGLDKKRALLYGGPAGLIFQTPIEIFDGLYEGWGFSWSDMAANIFGSLLFVTQEALFDEQVCLMKFSYSPSIYPNYHHILGETQVQRFFYDYNGHTHWLSFGLNRITGIDYIPEWLNFAVGYSANGMIHEFDNPQYYMGKPFPHLERYRQYLFSFDVNFSKIPTKKKCLKKVFRAINILKVPFPSIELNRIDGIKFNPLYF